MDRLVPPLAVLEYCHDALTHNLVALCSSRMIGKVEQFKLVPLPERPRWQEPGYRLSRVREDSLHQSVIGVQGAHLSSAVAKAYVAYVV